MPPMRHRSPAPPEFLVQPLERRAMMSIGPADIFNGGANDAVFDAHTHRLHVVFYDEQSKTLKAQVFRDDGTSSAIVPVDGGVGAGAQVSVVQDANRIVHAAYYD